MTLRKGMVQSMVGISILRPDAWLFGCCSGFLQCWRSWWGSPGARGEHRRHSRLQEISLLTGWALGSLDPGWFRMYYIIFFFKGKCVFFKNRLFILLIFILAVLGLHYCERAFSSCGEWRLLFGCSAWASHCGNVSCCRAWALGHEGFSSCDAWASLLSGMWSLPGPGIKPDSLHCQADSHPVDHQGSPGCIILRGELRSKGRT